MLEWYSCNPWALPNYCSAISVKTKWWLVHGSYTMCFVSCLKVTKFSFFFAPRDWEDWLLFVSDARNCEVLSVDMCGALWKTNRCFQKSQLIPPGNPMVCHQASPKAHLNAVRCCKDADFCNRHSPPTLAPPPSTIATGTIPIVYFTLYTHVVVCFWDCVCVFLYYIASSSKGYRKYRKHDDHLIVLFKIANEWQKCLYHVYIQLSADCWAMWVSSVELYY